LAKAPGRSVLPSFGTSASMSRVRFCSLMDGETRATRPLCSPATPSTVTTTDCPTRTLVESRSGTASRSRSGWSLTMVATGAPAARNSPTEARRSLTAPSIGEATTVSTSCWRASSSSDRRWSSTACRLRTSSIESS
jgi:hypothetical protein